VGVVLLRDDLRSDVGAAEALPVGEADDLGDHLDVGHGLERLGRTWSLRASRSSTAAMSFVRAVGLIL
jgi:hypothetical protein